METKGITINVVNGIASATTIKIDKAGEVGLVTNREITFEAEEAPVRVFLRSVPKGPWEPDHVLPPHGRWLVNVPADVWRYRYRIVYEDKPGVGTGPLENLIPAQVWKVPRKKFAGHQFGKNTPTGGGEGGGRVGGS